MKSGKQKKDLTELVRTGVHKQYTHNSSCNTTKKLPKSGLVLFTMTGGDAGSGSGGDGGAV